MKKIYLLSILMVLCHTIFAQNVRTRDRSKQLTLTNEQMFERADFIFEGRLIYKSWETYDTANNVLSGEGFFTSAAIEIKHVFKGGDKIKNGTIELIIKGGTIYQKDEEGLPQMYRHFPPEFVNVATNRDAVFFCKVSTFPKSPYKREFDNEISVSHFLNEGTAVLQINYASNLTGYKHRVLGLNGLDFPDKKTFYEYLKQFKGLNVPKIEKKINQKPCPKEKIEEQKRLHKAFMEKQEKLAKIGEANRQKQLKKKTNIYSTLSLTIDNQEITGDNPTYFEFDVMGKANRYNTFLSNAICRLGFNTYAFGTYLVANDRITLTKGDAFSNSTYQTNVYDVNDYQITLGLSAQQAEVSSWDRTELTKEYQVLYHVKIEILEGAETEMSDLFFEDTDFTSMLSLYTATSTANWQDYISYDDTYYNDPPSISVTSKPIITYIQSENVPLGAGVGDCITIYGENFGDEPGEVFFTSNKKGGVTPDGQIDYLLGLDNCYLDYWTDTEISVKVPSLVTVGYELDTVFYGAGTGKIKVRTMRSMEVESESPLYIAYSILNDGNAEYPISRVYLAKQDCIDGFKFTLHKNMIGKTGAITCIKKALQTWSDLLDIDLHLEKNSNGQLVYANHFNSSHKNVIGLDFNYDGGMKTESKFFVGNSYCNYYRKWGSDIHISNRQWDYSTDGSIAFNKLSFYNAFLHEIGHILLQGHVNNPLDIMYYQIEPGGNVVNLTSNSIPVQSALNTITESEGMDWASLYVGTLHSDYDKPNISINAGTCSNYPIELESSYGGSNMGIFNESQHLVWSNNDVGKTTWVHTPGTYFVTAKYPGCKLKSDPVLVNQMKVTVHTQEQSNGTKYTYSVIGGTPPYTAVWDYYCGHQVCRKYSNELFISVNNSIIKKDGDEMKVIDLVVTDANGCQRIWQNPYAGNSGNDIVKPTVVYPNPSSGIVNIKADNYLKTEVYDTRDILIRESVTKQINLENLPKGFYFIKVFTESGTSFEKLILR